MISKVTSATQDTPSSTASFQFGSSLIIWILVAISIARLVSVVASNGETPFLSANDRSRWSAVAAILEDQTFAIDRLLEKRDSRGRSRTWYSIDMVRHRDATGSEHFYSSKPPLLTVMYAAIVWPITMIYQVRLSDNPLLIGRTALGVMNLVPMIAWWFWWRRQVIKLSEDFRSRWVLLLLGLFGTFLTTMLVTLNNHLHAAMLFTITLSLLASLLLEPESSPKSRSRKCKLLGLGIAASLLFACELPALAWAAAIPLILFRKTSWLGDWSFYVVGFLPFLIANVGVNWYAHGDWRPPYYHREALGELVLSIPASEVPVDIDSASDVSQLTALQLFQLNAVFDSDLIKSPLGIQSPLEVQPARRMATLRLQGKSAAAPNIHKRYALVYNNKAWHFHQWNDWYDYPSSYWLPENKRGVDLGESSLVIYVWNSFFGTYGVLSLTPFFVFCIPGAWFAARSNDAATCRIAIAVVLVTLVCFAFFFSRDQLDRNYGGVCCGFRWLFWLIPGWLILAANFFATQGDLIWRNARASILTFVVLLVSVFSTWFAAANPWQHPWIYQLLQ